MCDSGRIKQLVLENTDRLRSPAPLELNLPVTLIKVTLSTNISACFHNKKDIPGWKKFELKPNQMNVCMCCFICGQVITANYNIVYFSSQGWFWEMFLRQPGLISVRKEYMTADLLGLFSVWRLLHSLSPEQQLLSDHPGLWPWMHIL